jgi:hypothetical protein
MDARAEEGDNQTGESLCLTMPSRRIPDAMIRIDLKGIAWLKPPPNTKKPRRQSRWGAPRYIDKK